MPRRRGDGGVAHPPPPVDVAKRRAGTPEGYPGPTVGQYYSVPVLLILKRVCVLARDCGSALAPRAGGLRKMVNVIHPPPTTSSNAPKTEKRLGRGAVKSGACRANRTPAHLGSAPELQTPKPNRMKPAE